MCLCVGVYMCMNMIVSCMFVCAHIAFAGMYMCMNMIVSWMFICAHVAFVCTL